MLTEARQQECPVCQETKYFYLFTVRELQVVRCAGCSLISLNPSLQETGYVPSAKDEVTTQDRWTWPVTGTEKEAALEYIASIKERGLSSGRVLLMARAVDPILEEWKDFDLNQAVSIEDMNAGVNPEETYDGAVIVDQLEKSSAPLRTLREVQRALKPEGLLLLAMPSPDSWPAQLLDSQWSEWRQENRYYFDRATVQSLLLKAGFSEIRIEPERRTYTLRHLYERSRTYPRSSFTQLIGLLHWLVPTFLQHVRVKLASSRMIVTARKAITRSRPLCSIIVPAFNEAKTFPILMDSLLAKELPGMDKEVIVVESNSTDGTREITMRYASRAEVKLVLQNHPKGKGNAVREGFAHAEGDIILIQDADLEYDLNDYAVLLEPLASYRAAFVLGTRHKGNWKMRKFAGEEGLSTLFNTGHIFFRALINTLYRQHMSDPFTMFKVFRRDCLYGLKLECNRFDFDHELVIKMVRKGYTPLELPVNYISRSYKEGKKINVLRDPLTWLWVDLKYRFCSPYQHPRTTEK